MLDEGWDVSKAMEFIKAKYEGAVQGVFRWTSVFSLMAGNVVSDRLRLGRTRRHQPALRHISSPQRLEEKKIIFFGWVILWLFMNCGFCPWAKRWMYGK